MRQTEADELISESVAEHPPSCVQFLPCVPRPRNVLSMGTVGHLGAAKGSADIIRAYICAPIKCKGRVLGRCAYLPPPLPRPQRHSTPQRSQPSPLLVRLLALSINPPRPFLVTHSLHMYPSLLFFIYMFYFAAAAAGCRARRPTYLPTSAGRCRTSERTPS